MKFLKKLKMKSSKINNEKLKPKWLIELMYKNLLIGLGITLIVLLVFRVKLKCLKNCEFYCYDIFLILSAIFEINAFMYCFRPELKAIEKEIEVVLRFPETEGLSPPILQLNEVSFAYPGCKNVLENVNLGATLESRICIVS